MLKRATCPLKKDVLWAYFSALSETEAWPIESAAKGASVHTLLGRLRAKFKYLDPHHPPGAEIRLADTESTESLSTPSVTLMCTSTVCA